MNSTFKAAFILTAVCANSVVAAPILPEGLVGVTQENMIDRSLAPHSDLPQTCAVTFRTGGWLPGMFDRLILLDAGSRESGW